MSQCSEQKVVEEVVCGGMVIEVVEFKPTREELTLLAFHYLDRFFDVQETYAQGQSGSWERREKEFALGRFNSLAETLCPDGNAKEFQPYIDARWAGVEQLRSVVQREYAAYSNE